MKDCGFRLDIRKMFFSMRVLRHRNRLPREVMNTPSLEVFMASLEGALSNLVKWKLPLPIVGELKIDDF